MDGAGLRCRRPHNRGHRLRRNTHRSSRSRGAPLGARVHRWALLSRRFAHCCPGQPNFPLGEAARGVLLLNVRRGIWLGGVRSGTPGILDDHGVGLRHIARAQRGTFRPNRLWDGCCNCRLGGGCSLVASGQVVDRGFAPRSLGGTSRFRPEFPAAGSVVRCRSRARYRLSNASAIA